MWQQQISRNKEFNNHNNKYKKIQCSFYMRVWVYVEDTAIASSIKMICSPVCVCVYVGKVYLINVSIVGRSKEDKKFTLPTYMCMRVCIYVRDLKYGPFVFLSPHVHFLWSLGTTSRVRVVGKRTSHASLLCVLCAMPSAASRPYSWKLKWIKNRIF